MAYPDRTLMPRPWLSLPLLRHLESKHESQRAKISTTSVVAAEGCAQGAGRSAAASCRQPETHHD